MSIELLYIARMKVTVSKLARSLSNPVVCFVESSIATEGTGEWLGNNVIMCESEYASFLLLSSPQKVYTVLTISETLEYMDLLTYDGDWPSEYRLFVEHGWRFLVFVLERRSA